MENPDIPNDILLEIFSKLPSRSVGRWCLSRFWRARLSNSQFINLHFTRKPYQETLLLSPDGYMYQENVRPIVTDTSIHTISLPIKDEAVSKKHDNMPDTWVEVLGSCNGFVLILDKHDNMILVNPVTMEQVSVPNPVMEQESELNLPYRLPKICGFGYDASNNDSKIVTIEHYRRGVVVTDYSVKNRTRMNHNLPSHIYVHIMASGALVNGALHWCAHDSQFPMSRVILAFDLAIDEFRVILVHTNADGAELYCEAFVLGLSM